jgi:hypothetical protein
MDTARPGGAPGAPRLLGRLTAELISRSPQYMSCISNYEIDLRGGWCRGGRAAGGNGAEVQRSRRRCAAAAAPARPAPEPRLSVPCAGNKIGAIENLGATEVRATRGGRAAGARTGLGRRSRSSRNPGAERLLPRRHWPRSHDHHHLCRLPPQTARRTNRQNQFDSIDLSDNAVVRLEGFPRLPRLKALYLNNNRVAKVARNLQGGRAGRVSMLRRAGFGPAQLPAGARAANRGSGRGAARRQRATPSSRLSQRAARGRARGCGSLKELAGRLRRLRPPNPPSAHPGHLAARH